MAIAKAALLSLLGRGKRSDEQTTSGSAGGYTVPLGTPLRRTFPSYPDADGDEEDEELLRRVEEQLQRLRRRRR